MQSCGCWGLKIVQKARPPKLTPCMSGAGKEHSDGNVGDVSQSGGRQ